MKRRMDAGTAPAMLGDLKATVFLTVSEAAALVRVSPKRLRNLMADGTLREGVHFTRPIGLRPRFKSKALLDWLNGAMPVGAAA